ncbi:MAG: hypothetical protein IPM47_05020 [Sphingobacteriales bacterium]|nr:MAG: hypothetical protein IPM47_05020 [Sphingobacteriales bacterium]
MTRTVLIYLQLLTIYVQPLFAGHKAALLPDSIALEPAVIAYDTVNQQSTNQMVEICISKINVLNIKFPKIPLIDFWHVCIKTGDGDCIGFYPKNQNFFGLFKASLIRETGVIKSGTPERCFTTYYDAGTMQEAVVRTQKRYRYYNLFFKNCQHFIADVIAEYQWLYNHSQ